MPNDLDDIYEEEYHENSPFYNDGSEPDNFTDPDDFEPEEFDDEEPEHELEFED